MAQGCRAERVELRRLGLVPELEHDGIVPTDACGEKSPEVASWPRRLVPEGLVSAQVTPGHPAARDTLFRLSLLLAGRLGRQLGDADFWASRCPKSTWFFGQGGSGVS
jgi:hypothetical protein